MAKGAAAAQHTDRPGQQGAGSAQGLRPLPGIGSRFEPRAMPVAVRDRPGLATCKRWTRPLTPHRAPLRLASCNTSLCSRGSELPGSSLGSISLRAAWATRKRSSSVTLAGMLHSLMRMPRCSSLSSSPPSWCTTPRSAHGESLPRAPVSQSSTRCLAQSAFTTEAGALRCSTLQRLRTSAGHSRSKASQRPRAPAARYPAMAPSHCG
mmetsp:Transcript_38016/g.114905  ORF Transcript_38016/g.114905 Transcript_38016/m.114905 type:complete len:208 (+) Transcript_38016:123-746(+)